MKCNDLKVVSLNITEDYYEYKALFRLCADDRCMDIDLSQISDEVVINAIKKEFELDESSEEIEKIIMSKIMEASQLESRINEGKNCCKEPEEKKLQRSIDSLSSS